MIRAFETAKEFEEWYVANSLAAGVSSEFTVEMLHAWGRYGTPCDCGEEMCTGWQMAYKE